MAIRYRFFATLLDRFQDYLDNEDTWERLWGNSENPSKSAAEYEQEALGTLIDCVNRKHYYNEFVARGTALNDIVDLYSSLDRHATLDTVTSGPDEEGKTYSFPSWLIEKLASHVRNGLQQCFLRGTLHTNAGDVELYGFPDYIMPDRIVDLKTTSRYTVGKYRKGWQRIVYPYLAQKDNSGVDMFEYYAVEFGKSGINVFSEAYIYRPETDITRLRLHCEELAAFCEENRSIITNKKIFNEE